MEISIKSWRLCKITFSKRSDTADYYTTGSIGVLSSRLT